MLGLKVVSIEKDRVGVFFSKERPYMLVNSNGKPVLNQKNECFLWYPTDIGFVSKHHNSITYTFIDEKVPERLAKLPARYSTLKHFNITGTDFEGFFLRQGKVVPATKVLPSKDRVNSGSPFWDGVQWEIAPQASNCHEVMVGRVGNSSKILLKLAEERRLKVSLSSVVEVDKIRLDGNAKRLGCSASLNAYDSAPSFLTEDAPFRTAGAHIHFSHNWMAASRVDPAFIVRQLDSWVGPLLVWWCRGTEDPRRRLMYGQAGEYRLPAHGGIEWRVPPPSVISNSTLLYGLFDTARYVWMDALFGLGKVPAVEDEISRRIINQSDVDAARQWLNHHQKVYDRITKEMYGKVATGVFSNLQAYTDLTADALTASSAETIGERL